MLTKKGGPEVLQVVALPVEAPGPGQLRVRICAAGVGSTDLIMLTGSYLYAPKIPFVPGYEVAGVVDAIGAGVTAFKIGERVAALTVYGSFAELLIRDAEHFLPIPDGVSCRDAIHLYFPASVSKPRSVVFVLTANGTNAGEPA
jgi:NADPH:quinone reductase